MDRIVYKSPRCFEIEKGLIPRPGHGEALLRIQGVGVCGSDMHLYRDGRIGSIRIEKPFVIGHECMGIVESLGDDVDRSWLGARVAIEPARYCGSCDWCLAGRNNICPEIQFLGLPPTEGALTDYMVYPVKFLERLPDWVSDEVGVALEPFAIALHAVDLMKIRPGQTVVVLGAGVLGISVLQLVSLYRGVRVICVEPIQSRLDRALEMGAAHAVRVADGSREEALRKILELPLGLGADVVFECSGADDAIWNMVEIARPEGHIAVIGTNADDRMLFPNGPARRKGLTIRFVKRSLNTLKRCLHYTEQGLIQPGKLVTHLFSKHEVNKAFEMVDKYEDNILKAIIKMND